MSKNVTVPRDIDINPDRNRGARLGTMLGLCAGTILCSAGFTHWLGSQFFSNPIMLSISTGVGFSAGIGLVVATFEKYFLIRNGPTSMFLTQNSLASLLGKSDINIAYGPGTHFSFPWERRIASNTLSLEEAEESFSFTVQLPDGDLHGEGAFVLRADQEHPVTFLSSISAVTSDLTKLITADVLAFFKGMTAMEALGKVGDLNTQLDTKYNATRTDIEKKHGVHVSSVKISKLLPSEELRRTLSGITEAEAVQRGVQILLGKASQAEVDAALQRGEITSDDIKRAREHFLAISGNMNHIEIKRSEFDLNIRGLDPETAKALADLAKTPAAQAAAVAAGTRKPTVNKKSKGTSS